MKKLYISRRIKYRFGFYRKEKRGFNLSVFIVRTIIYSIIAGSLMLFAVKRVGNLAIELGTSELENTIKSNCNKIVAEELLAYQNEFGKIENKIWSEDNKINATAIDFSVLNDFKCRVTERVTEYINATNGIVCHIPIGAFISNDIFVAYGAEIPIKIIASGSAEVEFSDDFITGGVNQTRHRLMLRLKIKIRLHTLCDKKESEAVLDIPVTETIMVGEVPSMMAYPLD